MPRTSANLSRLPFVADPHSVMRNSGRQIDWANVSATNADGKKVVYAGTVVGELLGTGKVSPRVVTTNPAVGIMETTAVEGDTAASLSGYGILIGGHFYENLLPDASGGPPKVLAAAIKTELNSNGYAWSFEQYGDNR
jgi:hypothetical protein